MNIIISGGGTGGHIFPAVSIANAIMQKCPDAKILFVGANGRMEMQRVPEAGYEIKGLPVRGLIRPLWSPKNISVMIDFMRSKSMVKSIIRDFKPQVAVGVGGYASAPTLNAAHAMGIPCLIQEQNSYAGVTNKSLAKKARKICVAYDGMERFFPTDRLIKTGNPVRQNLLETSMTREDAVRSFGLDPAKKVVLLVGGSLGARTVNESILQHLDVIKANPDVQFVWQTGKYYSMQIAQQLGGLRPTEGGEASVPDRYTPVYQGVALPNLKVMAFIRDMGAAYRAADLVVSRAGAGSISEFCLLGKPVILVPSPNVAEDHQTKNAMALANVDAALVVKDAEATDKLLPLILKTVADDARLASLSANVLTLALHNSAEVIADEVIKLAENV